MTNLKTRDMELALVRYLNNRVNFIIPNVFWGLNFNYELDLMVVKNSGYAYEIEIKTSISDLKAEKWKKNKHYSNRIKQLYFAIPWVLLQKAEPLIPERAGIYTVDEYSRVRLYRKPKINVNARRLTEKEIIKLGKLSNMRMWNAIETLNQRIKDGTIKNN